MTRRSREVKVIYRQSLARRRRRDENGLGRSLLQTRLPADVELNGARAADQAGRSKADTPGFTQ